MEEFAPERAVPGKATVVEPDPGVCEECGGRGWKIVADGGAGTAVRCDCSKRGRASEYLARAGIPERYRRCKLANFQTSAKDRQVSQQLLRAQTISQRYVEGFFDPASQRFRETGLIYIGPPGVGKTHLAAAVLAELIQRYQVRGRFVDFTSLIHQIQSTFDPGSPESKQEILDPVVRAEALVLDELGSQKPTEWVMDTLYLIMNTRYTRRLATIFTTNYPLRQAAAPAATSPEDRRLGSDSHAARRLDGGPSPARPARPRPANTERLDQRISHLLVSRIYEMAQPVTLEIDPVAWDFRREVMMARNRIGG